MSDHIVLVVKATGTSARPHQALADRSQAGITKRSSTLTATSIPQSGALSRVAASGRMAGADMDGTGRR